jgi:hypothetical protein
MEKLARRKLHYIEKMLGPPERVRGFHWIHEPNVA